MRLYCTGSGSLVKWVTAANMKEAKDKLGPKARVATDEDCRSVWMLGRMWELTSDELAKLFGISRQSAQNWRRRAGDDLPTRTDHKEAVRNRSIRMIAKGLERPTFSDLVEATGLAKKRVREYVEKASMNLRKRPKMPPDDELLELQKGRTWWELAAVTGLQLGTLRKYIYGKPALARAMAAVRVRERVGTRAHGKIPVQEIRDLYKKGMGVHVVAETLKIESMTVRYWFQKWNKEARNETPDNGSAPADAVAGGNDGGAGHP